MQYVLDRNESITVSTVLDLPRLKQVLEVLHLKPNYSELSRQLGCDRRTVKAYYEKGVPSKERKRVSRIDSFYEIIETLLSEDTPQKFYYKRVLWQYLKDNHGLDVAYSTFRGYIQTIPQFQSYFDGKKHTLGTIGTVRFETDPGEQAQIDWKENINFMLKDGSYTTIHILLMSLGYSRYKLAKVTLDKSLTTLQDGMVEFFEELGGVPQSILTDNMKSVMVAARRHGSQGQLHPKAEQFSKDMGFRFQPCMSYRPQTKGKVECQMKILDELHAYQGQLIFDELKEKVDQIILRSNLSISQATRRIPTTMLIKEKESLLPLPKQVIRDSYRVKHPKAKVLHDNTISFQGNHYSVPPGYVAKSMTLQVIDTMLYIYDNTKLVAVHALSKKKINYLPSHYEAQLQKTIPYLSADEVKEKARSNLEKIGAIYEYKD